LNPQQIKTRKGNQIMQTKITKIFKIVIVLLLVFTLFACEKDPNNSVDPDPPNGEKDTIRPLIMVNADAQTIRVKQNQILDLKDTLIAAGIKAMDNVDGIITNKIEINVNDFDISKPGEYIIDVFVFDSSNNKSEVKFITVIVEEYYGLIMEYPIFTGEIPDEVKTLRYLIFGLILFDIK
jgi:hypothetical protein